MTHPVSHKPTLSPFRRLAIAACLLVGCIFTLRALTPDVVATLAVSASCDFSRSDHDSATSGEQSQFRVSADSVAASPTEPQFVTKNIEDIQLGQRVVGTNPLQEQTQPASDIDPATWRAVRLSMVQHGVKYDLAFMRPLSWIEATGAAVGRSIHMELHEMGLGGPAEVVAVDPCPEIEPDDGTGRNVVTGTMSHPAGNILHLDITGLDEPLGVTDTHPIWSETRQNFVPARQLEIGEQLRSLTGESATLTKIHPHRGPPEMVFNLEVDGEHVYSVAGSGLLAHNNCPVVVNLGGEGEIAGALNINGPWITPSSPLSRAAGRTIQDKMDEGAQFISAQMDQLPIRNSSVDTVLTNGVRIGGASHLGPFPQISEIKRILTDGGSWIHEGVIQILD